MIRLAVCKMKVSALETLQESYRQARCGHLDLISRVQSHLLIYCCNAQKWPSLNHQRVLHSKDSDLPTRAPNTKRTQTMTQASIAVSPSAFGMLVVMVLNMLTRTRKTVIRSVILPGTMSGGMRKEIQLTMTNIPEGR